MKRMTAAAALLSLVSACQKTPDKTAQTNEQNTPRPAAPAPLAPSAPADRSAPATAPEPGTSGGLPNDRTPLPEPSGPVDPKSAEAAGQVVQHYGALIEQKRFDQAESLWGDVATAKQATAQLKTYSDAHLEMGKPTDMEGAAGSIYITVPIVLYGKLANGTAVQRRADVILRRVNDVPGSTEAQRRWHIERIDWKDAD
jgi:hypothetical protein